MFFCEECKQRNNWPGIWAFSYGDCEICGTRAHCYDVPSKHLPPPKRAKEVHLSHCCQMHGCKYGDKDCIVKKSGDQLHMCDFCFEDIYEDGGWEDAHLMDEMFNKGRKNAYTEIVKIAQGDWELRA